jgi:hypothetical protein
MLSDSWIKKEFAAPEIRTIEQQESLLEEMGITKEDSAYLRKSALSADEAVAAKQEELSNIRTHKGRKKNWLEYLDLKARMGLVLPGCEVIRRLRTILPQLLVYDGRVRGTWGLVSPVTKTFENGFHSGWEYLGWAHSDWNPEFEIDFIDEDGVPKGRRQGYRTLLLNLITRKDGTGTFQLKERGIVRDGTGDPLKIITEEQALQAFGRPTTAVASNFRMQLWEWRNGRKLSPIVWS